MNLADLLAVRKAVRDPPIQMSDDQRLAFHQEKSASNEEKTVEPNSALGGAIGGASTGNR